jgi:hypothetical protein
MHTRALLQLTFLIGLSELLALGQAAAQPPNDPVTSCGQARTILNNHEEHVPLVLRPGHKLLFIDPSVLKEATDVTWTVHQPHKMGAVIRPDRPWEGNSIQIRSAPIWSAEERAWKLWYFGDSDGRSGVATSQDGIHWEKPSLGKVLFNGTRDNNMVSATGTDSDRAAGMIMNVVYDPDDPDANRRYKALAGADNRRLIVSPNGVDWTTLDTPTISGDDESSLYYDRDNRLFITTIKHQGPYGRSVYLSVSRNFDDWTDSRDCLIFHSDHKDQLLGVERIHARMNNPAFQKPEYDLPATYNVDVYNMAVMRYEGLYLALPAMFHKTAQVPKDWPGFEQYNLSPALAKEVHQYGDWTGFHQLELLSSHDLIEWQHAGERQPILEDSPIDGHPYDLQTILPSSPVIRGNEIWFYYTGLRKYAIRSEGLPDIGAICLAKLRLDGFVSLSAGQTPGTVVTKPLLLSPGSLHLNVDAPGGEVSAEILDSEGKHVLEGFALANSIPLTGDHLDAEIKWKKAALSSLAGRRVCIRFTLRRADLYSAWVE